MTTFIFSYKRVVEVTIQADDEAEARTKLQAEVDRVNDSGMISIPRAQMRYELLSAY